jgi:hypothetical protein
MLSSKKLNTTFLEVKSSVALPLKIQKMLAINYKLLLKFVPNLRKLTSNIKLKPKENGN